MQLVVVHPTWLLSLLALPLLALLLWQRAQAARVAARAFAAPAALARWGLSSWGAKAQSKALLGLVVLAGLVVGLAEPRLAARSGPKGQVASGGTLVVVLDLSRSMRAEDMGGRARLFEATRLATAMLPAFAGWRVAVVGFAGDAVALIPPTTDHRAVSTLLAAAAPGQAPGLGTNVEKGIEAGIQVLRRPGPRALLLLSDGEQLDGDLGRTTAQLKALGPAVGVVGVGTPAGSRIPLPSEAFGEPRFVAHEGADVVSRLEEDPLKAFATASGGRFWRMADGLTPSELSNHLGRGASAEGTSGAVEGWPLFLIPLALAFLALWLECALAWWPKDWRALLRPWGRLSGRAAGLVVLLLALPGYDDPRAWWTERQARELMEQGATDAAIDAYRRATNAFPDAWAIHHNLGSLVYAEGRYPEAINQFRRAFDMAPEAMQGRIAYQLGNALFMQAESEKEPTRYRHAIEEYKRSLKAHPDDADAKHNLALAEARLKEAENRASASPPPSTPGQGGQQGQAGGFGGPGFAVGANPHYTPGEAPKDLPTPQEVEASLLALDEDERQRQAEAGEASAERASQSRQGGLADALQQLSNERDW